MADGTKLELEDLVQRIAHYWGSEDAVETDGGKWRFRGDEGHSVYEITPNGKRAAYFEDSGRPCGTRKVTGGKVVVRCLTDAPDAFWYVGTDGSYTDYHGKTIVLPAQPVGGCTECSQPLDGEGNCVNACCDASIAFDDEPEEGHYCDFPLCPCDRNQARLHSESAVYYADEPDWAQ